MRITEYQQFVERLPRAAHDMEHISNFGRIVACAPPRELIAQHCERYFRIDGQKRQELEGFRVEDVEVNRGSLEEVFIKLTGRSFSQDEMRGEKA